jgi:hypothetical protein
MSPNGTIINGVGTIRGTRTEISVSKIAATMEKVEILALLQITLGIVIDIEDQIQMTLDLITIVEEMRERFPEAEIAQRIGTIGETIAEVVGKIVETEAIAKVQWKAESAEIQEIIRPNPTFLIITHIINLTGNVHSKRVLILRRVNVLGETTANTRTKTKLIWQLKLRQTNLRRNGCNPLLCK